MPPSPVPVVAPCPPELPVVLLVGVPLETAAAPPPPPPARPMRVPPAQFALVPMQSALAPPPPPPPFAPVDDVSADPPDAPDPVLVVVPAAFSPAPPCPPVVVVPAPPPQPRWVHSSDPAGKAVAEIVVVTTAALPPTPPIVFGPPGVEPPPPPPVNVTCVERMPAGTSRLALLYQPVTQDPVEPLMATVVVVVAPATNGELTSGAKDTTLVSIPTRRADVTVTVTDRRMPHEPRWARP